MRFDCAVGILLGGIVATSALPCRAELRVGAAAINLRADGSMPLAGMLESGYADRQEGELRAVAVVLEQPGAATLAIVACDVLWLPRWLVDEALAEIERATGIPPDHVLVNATHTHHAPGTAPAHGFGFSLRWCEELRAGIVRAVTEAHSHLSPEPCKLYFHLGSEATVGSNSRLLLPDGTVTWIGIKKYAEIGRTTGPFDPQLPVLDFRGADGQTRALIYNHSTHTIGTRDGNVRSPSFYGLAAQELETELGGVVSFLEGASGSTHNVNQVPVAAAVKRLKTAIREARDEAQPRPVERLVAIRRPFSFRVRTFDDAQEDAAIARYTTKYFSSYSDRVREIFATMRQQLASQQGHERETWLQVLAIGDVAVVGVPAEYFTSLGVEIKRRSPFKYTLVGELANDWIGYLPDREGHRLGGYQTWMGLHCYAEVGTGERVADEVVAMLHEAFPRNDLETSRGPVVGGPGPSPPHTPAEAQTTLVLADPELLIELVAAEPQVASPVDMAWDADGRLFVAEMIGYPQAEGLGQVRMLADRDGDGTLDDAQVFAEGLNFPSSVMPYRDGLLVTCAPDILYLRDTDGDGVADTRQVLWTGFHAGSQQLRVNGLHWGLDNWIYGANGRSDGEVRAPDAADESAISIRGRDFRFDPRQQRFTAITGQSQFGLTHDQWGRRLLSWNTIPVRQAVIPEPYASARIELTRAAVTDCAGSDDVGEVFPISPPPPQFNAEASNHYNAMCGLTLFQGDQLGHGYQGDAFVCESLSNLITRRRFVSAGAALATHRLERGHEFLASTDPWFHPVNLATGPDGALYVVDFYRAYVEHPIYVSAEALRANTDWRHGAQRGRIWRIRHRDLAPSSADRRPQLSNASSPELLPYLEHPVAWWRLTAQRLLVERQDPVVVESLAQMARTSRRAEGRLHALYTLDGLAALDDAVLESALTDRQARVREHALRLVSSRLGGNEDLRSRALAMAGDPDPGVRMQLALLLGESELFGQEARVDALARIVRDGYQDRWIALAATSSLRDQAARVVRLVTDQDARWWSSPTAAQSRLLLAAGEQIARHAENGSEQVWSLLRPGGSGTGLYPRVGQVALVAGALRGGAGHTVAAEASDAELVALVAAATLIAQSAQYDPALREAALTVMSLQDVPSRSRPYIGALLSAAPTQPLVGSAARWLADLGDAALHEKIYENWARLPWSVRRSELAAAPRSASSRQALVAALERGLVAAVEIPPHVVKSLQGSAGVDGHENLTALLGADMTADRAAVVDAYRVALAAPGAAERGGNLFRQHCLTCHTMFGLGGRIGPNLSSVGARPAESLLVDILDPSRQVSPDHLAYTATTDAGQVHVGLLVAETATSVTLQPAEGSAVTLDRTHVGSLRANRQSLMPEGFERPLNTDAMADLLAFLRAPRRELLEPSRE